MFGRIIDCPVLPAGYFINAMAVRSPQRATIRARGRMIVFMAKAR